MRFLCIQSLLIVFVVFLNGLLLNDGALFEHKSSISSIKANVQSKRFGFRMRPFSSRLTTEILGGKKTSKAKVVNVNTNVNKEEDGTVKMTYHQTMIAGALSRTIAQMAVHPLNTFKTMLQVKHVNKAGKVTALPKILLRDVSMARLLKGADSQFIFSFPHGALYFYVIENVKHQISYLRVLPKGFEFLADLTSSIVSTCICSIISTPQMVITDRLMANQYPSLPSAVSSIIRSEGLKGFYRGWWAALAQKIPSYGLTWVLFQQLKRGYESFSGEKATGRASFVMGALAAAGGTTVMNPMDTIKTRLITQALDAKEPYKGVLDCFIRVTREEGVGTFYRSLPPRLLSVVPMIAIQFGVYEYIKANIVRTREEEEVGSSNNILKRDKDVRTGRGRGGKMCGSKPMAKSVRRIHMTAPVL